MGGCERKEWVGRVVGEAEGEAREWQGGAAASELWPASVAGGAEATGGSAPATEDGAGEAPEAQWSGWEAYTGTEKTTQCVGRIDGV